MVRTPYGICCAAGLGKKGNQRNMRPKHKEMKGNAGEWKRIKEKAKEMQRNERKSKENETQMQGNEKPMKIEQF